LVEEPCPLSLPYGLLDTQPNPLYTTNFEDISEIIFSFMENLVCKSTLQQALAA
jgi:hypothetical protein